jgi:hypothetical protein
VYDAYASHRAYRYPRLRYIIVTDFDIDFSHLVIVFSHLYSLLLCHVSARDRNLFICEILIHFSIPAKHGDGSINHEACGVWLKGWGVGGPSKLGCRRPIEATTSMYYVMYYVMQMLYYVMHQGLGCRRPIKALVEIRITTTV